MQNLRMLRVMKWLGIGCGGLLVVLIITGVVLWRTKPQLRYGADAVARVLATDELKGVPLKSVDDVIRYLKEHPDRYSLAVWEVGDEAQGYFHDADQAWPLASTMKIVPLALASSKIADGQWHGDDPTPEVDALYLPGSDGGAHPKALKRGGTATLAASLKAMTLYSDNAATDAVLLRLGRPAVVAAPAALGLPELLAPHPLTSMLVLARREYPGRAQADIDEESWVLAARLRDDAAYGKPLRDSFEKEGLGVSVAEQEAMARHFDNRGTARTYGRLMERIFTDATPRFALAREQLSWPMAKSKTTRADFVQFATKGGALPGILTSATFAETKTGKKRVLALFFHDLPFATWATLIKSFAQQAVEREVLVRDDGIAWLKTQLAAKAPAAK